MCAPDAPAPIDPADSSLRYIEGMSDPDLQEKILSAERTYRPQYAEVNLQDLDAYFSGIGGQPGILEQYRRATESAEESRAATASSQRESDVRDVETLGQRATEALRSSDPESARLIANQVRMNDDLFSRAQGVTAQQKRIAEQQARESFGARGRINDNVSVAAEILGREEQLQRNRAEYQDSAGRTFAMLQSTAADPFQAILGRPAGAMDFGAAYGAAGQGYLGASTPQLFDPDAGVNLALQEQANLANFNANVYGSQMGALGSLFGAAGSVIGGF